MASGSGSQQTNVAQFYRTVMDDVINGVKEAFLDEGTDEQVLTELRQLWESKLAATKVVEKPALPVAVSMPDIHIHPQFHAVATASNMAPYRPVVHGGARPVMSQLASASRLQLPGKQAQYASGPVQRMSVVQPTPLSAGGQGIVIGQHAVFSNGQQILIQAPSGAAQLIPGSKVIATAQVAQQPITLNQIRHAYTVNLNHPSQPKLPQMDGSSDMPGCSQDFNEQSVVKKRKGKGPKIVFQLDGATGLSDSEDSDADLNVNEDEPVEEEQEEHEEGEPLNSADDISDSDEDADTMFDADNQVVCQYDKITRSRNKWKFVLKDGIMNVNSRDYVFSKATGEAEW